MRRGLYMAKHYSDEFKEQAIELVNSGNKSQNQVARELGLTPSTLNSWMRKHRDDISGKTEQNTNEKELIKRLRELEEENAILKKAAAYFAKNLN